MKESIYRLLGLLGASAIVGGVTAGKAQAPTPAETDSLIVERQSLMTQLQDEAEVLGNIVAGLEPPDKLAETSRKIAQTAKESVEAFEKVAPGGRAKPEVWSSHAEFMKRMQDFAARAEAMAALAETGNMTAVIEVMPEALPCKACHDVYREPKRRS